MDIRSIGTALPNAASATKDIDDKKLKDACRDMEAVFLNMLLSRMRATVPKSGLIDNGKQDIVQSMYDSELTKNMASTGGGGLADFLYRQLQQQPSAKSR